MAENVIKSSRVNTILNSAVQSFQFRCALKDLKPEELKHCLAREKRVSAIRWLKIEARRKGVNIEEPVKARCPNCGWLGDPGKDWRAVVCPKCMEWISLK